MRPRRPLLVLLISTVVAPAALAAPVWKRAQDAAGVSSLMTPSFNGTLKSTRMNSRLPRRSRSRIDSFAMVSYRPFLTIRRSRSTHRLE